MLTVVLQNTNLEIIKTQRGKCLLSSEMIEARKKENSPEYRPDILHQCLLILLDSPLNKSGNLRVLVEMTTKKVITVNPQVRLPRVYSRFTGLLIQLLERHRIYSGTERAELMKVSKDPLETHLDSTSVRIGMSREGENFFDFVKNIKSEKTDTIKTEVNKQTELMENNSKSNSLNDEIQKTKSYIFYINAVASGEDPTEGMDHVLALSSYPLSAATCCSKVCTQFEELLNIF